MSIFKVGKTLAAVGVECVGCGCCEASCNVPIVSWSCFVILTVKKMDFYMKITIRDCNTKLSLIPWV